MGIIGMIEKCINFSGSMIWSCDSWLKLHLDKVLTGGSSQVFAPWLPAPCDAYLIKGNRPMTQKYSISRLLISICPIQKLNK